MMCYFIFSKMLEDKQWQKTSVATDEGKRSANAVIEKHTQAPVSAKLGASR